MSKEEKEEIENNSNLEAPAQKVKNSCRYGRRAGDSGSGSKIWIVSFTDIMALMLTFFVLLYSMSAPQSESWDEMTSALHKEFNKFLGARYIRGPQDTIDISRINYNRALDLNYLQALIGRHIENEESLRSVELRSVGGGLVVSFPQELVFEEGQAEMSDLGSDAIYALAVTLSRIRNRIEVIGHTDPNAISGQNDRFSSNWDLSLSRASTVAAALRKAGYERPLMVRGLANAMYDSLPESLPEEGRLRLARRVDIVIMDDDGTLDDFMGLSY